MNVLIFGSAEIENYHFIYSYLQKSPVKIICCDGGLLHLFKMNVLPDMIVGDFDSVDLELLEFYKNKNVEIKTFPTEKDKTDMEIGIEYALEMKPEEITIFGGIGSRLDHTLQNVQILYKILIGGSKAKLVNEYNTIQLINQEIKLSGDVGQLVSLIPMSEKVTGVTTNKLKYELQNAQLWLGNSLGVSNVMTAPEASVEIKSGLLLVIQSMEKK